MSDTNKLTTVFVLTAAVFWLLGYGSLGLGLLLGHLFVRGLLWAGV